MVRISSLRLDAIRRFVLMTLVFLCFIFIALLRLILQGQKVLGDYGFVLCRSSNPVVRQGSGASDSFCFDIDVFNSWKSCSDGFLQAVHGFGLTSAADGVLRN